MRGYLQAGLKVRHEIGLAFEGLRYLLNWECSNVNNTTNLLICHSLIEYWLFVFVIKYYRNLMILIIVEFTIGISISSLEIHIVGAKTNNILYKSEII